MQRMYSDDMGDANFEFGILCVLVFVFDIGRQEAGGGGFDNTCGALRSVWGVASPGRCTPSSEDLQDVI